jgi:predicted nucleic acid-binding protein
MKYVLDASVGLKFVLHEDLSLKALQLRDDFRQQLHELLAPESYLAGIAHALTCAERRGILRPPQAAALDADMLTPPPAFYPIPPLLPRAIDLSSQLRIGVYDCLYLALAEREGCDVLTADDRLVNALPGYPLVSLAAL